MSEDINFTRYFYKVSKKYNLISSKESNKKVKINFIKSDDKLNNINNLNNYLQQTNELMDIGGLFIGYFKTYGW